jgi:DNA-binding GntR family transcriptional regulator
VASALRDRKDELEGAYERLRRLILEGEYGPDERLVEE